MTKPRVFVSSTCFDLAEVRNGLAEFIRGYGFEPVLNEQGGVFYDIDKAVDDSCLAEVGSTNLFVLIVGGRWGSPYSGDPSKSITNAEYEAARRHNVPVFTFIKREVARDYRFYCKNRNKPGIDGMEYESLEHSASATNIFGFVDQLYAARVNNSVMEFDLSTDIIDLLRKQWAGLVYELLRQRTLSQEVAAATDLLEKLANAGEQVEKLVKRVYASIDPAAAPSEIAKVEQEAGIVRFAQVVEKVFRDPIRRVFASHDAFLAALALTPRPDHWQDYVSRLLHGEVRCITVEEYSERMQFNGILDPKTHICFSVSVPGLNSVNSFRTDLYAEVKNLPQLYQPVRNASDEEIRKALVSDAINVSNL